MAIELGIEATLNAGLTPAQIELVARRINAPEGKRIVFSRDGMVLHTDAEQRGTLALHGETYAARREGSRIEIEMITLGSVL